MVLAFDYFGDLLLWTVRRSVPLAAVCLIASLWLLRRVAGSRPRVRIVFAALVSVYAFFARLLTEVAAYDDNSLHPTPTLLSAIVFVVPVLGAVIIVGAARRDPPRWADKPIRMVLAGVLVAGLHLFGSIIVLLDIHGCEGTDCYEIPRMFSLGTFALGWYLAIQIVRDYLDDPGRDAARLDLIDARWVLAASLGAVGSAALISTADGDFYDFDVAGPTAVVAAVLISQVASRRGLDATQRWLASITVALSVFVVWMAWQAADFPSSSSGRLSFAAWVALLAPSLVVMAIIARHPSRILNRWLVAGGTALSVVLVANLALVWELFRCDAASCFDLPHWFPAALLAVHGAPATMLLSRWAPFSGRRWAWLAGAVAVPAAVMVTIVTAFPGEAPTELLRSPSVILGSGSLPMASWTLHHVTDGSDRPLCLEIAPADGEPVLGCVAATFVRPAEPTLLDRAQLSSNTAPNAWNTQVQGVAAWNRALNSLSIRPILGAVSMQADEVVAMYRNFDEEERSYVITEVSATLLPGIDDRALFIDFEPWPPLPQGNHRFEFRSRANGETLATTGTGRRELVGLCKRFVDYDHVEPQTDLLLNHHLPSADPFIDSAFELLYQGDETVPGFNNALEIAANLARANCVAFD